MGSCFSREPPYCEICMYYFDYNTCLLCSKCKKKYHFKCLLCFDQRLMHCPLCGGFIEITNIRPNPLYYTY